jgi:hypothetical protein
MRLVMKKMIMIAIIAATLVTIYMMKNKEEQTQPAPSVETTPAAEEVKTEEAAPAEQPAPSVEATPAAEEVKTEEAAPAEQPAPSVEATPAAEETPATEEVK